MCIRTELSSCILRAWQPADKAALLRHANNRNVWRNLTDAFPHPYTESDADHWLQLASKPGPDLHLAIAHEGEAVGGIGVIAGEGTSRHTGRFGYWLAEPYWGRGMATVAVRAMAAHLMAAGRYARLEALVFAWNPPSMRVLEKAGFVREGMLRRSVFKDGQLIDSVVYALVRGDA